MPAIKNARRERFVQLMFEGKLNHEAYALAGYKGDRAAASHTAARPDVAARLKELQDLVAERVIEKTAITRADILIELAKVAMAPLDDEHVRPADKRGACMDYAKIEGWVIDRVELGGVGDFANMADDELMRVIREKAAGLGLPAPKLN